MRSLKHHGGGGGRGEGGLSLACMADANVQSLRVRDAGAVVVEVERLQGCSALMEMVESVRS